MVMTLCNNTLVCVEDEAHHSYIDPYFEYSSWEFELFLADFILIWIGHLFFFFLTSWEAVEEERVQSMIFLSLFYQYCLQAVVLLWANILKPHVHLVMASLVKLDSLLAYPFGGVYNYSTADAP